jgi:hypothetical protein
VTPDQWIAGGTWFSGTAIALGFVAAVYLPWRDRRRKQVDVTSAWHGIVHKVADGDGTTRLTIQYDVITATALPIRFVTLHLIDVHGHEVPSTLVYEVVIKPSTPGHNWLAQFYYPNSKWPQDGTFTVLEFTDEASRRWRKTYGPKSMKIEQVTGKPNDKPTASRV